MSAGGILVRVTLLPGHGEFMRSHDGDMPGPGGGSWSEVVQVRRRYWQPQMAGELSSASSPVETLLEGQWGAAGWQGVS